MDQEEFKIIFRRYVAGACSKEERLLVEKIVLKNPMISNWQWDSEEQKLLMKIKIKQGIDKRIKRPKAFRRMYWLSVAAAAIVLLGLSYFIWLNQSIDEGSTIQIASVSASQTTGIILRTTEGKIIPLAIDQEADIQHLLGSNKEDKGSYTIEVPAGEQFNFSLPDGTKVWLNAATKISFPRTFSTSSREVQLEGEAYFEVAKNKDKLFKVKANGTEVVVHGTHFNVSAYPLENSVKTTLFEGLVTVRKDKKELNLTPGFEIVSLVNEEKMHLQKADLDQTMAWRNGYFIFDGMDVTTIMKTVARWYNISVITDKPLPVKRIGGSFPIDGKLDDLLQDLELLSGFKFIRNGKEVRIVW